jgi:hypothetical protein
MLSRDQASPLGIHDALIPLVRGPVLGDIGFGSGFQATVLAHQLAMHGHPLGRVVGVEFSAKAVGKAPPVFAEAHQASSDRLPLADQSVDTALSLNCLEHLWTGQVGPAIAEMARVSRGRVIIVAPWPETVEVRAFLRDELPAAQADPDPLGRAEFLDLVGYLHKCVMIPQSMLAAGFSLPLRLNSLAPESAIYVGEAAAIDASRVQALGLAQRDWPEEADYRRTYAQLVHDTATMGLARHCGWRYPAVCALSAARHGLAAGRALRAALP